MKEIIVIGGGAAGMMAALSARKAGAHVTLAEHNEKLGKKLYITGKGRCNLTNDADADAFFAHIPRNPRFLYSAFSHFDNQALMSLMESLGVPLKVERGGRVFPVSDRSSDITRALERELLRWGIDVRLHSAIEAILAPSGQVAGVQYQGGAIQQADAVIVATGGKSYSPTGSTGDGYAFARALGHEIVPPRPALIPLETMEEWPGELMGLSLKNVTLNYYKGKKKLFSELGELLFTHFGLSGPLCLSLSSYLPDEPMGQKIFIDLKPALSEQTLDNRLLRDFKEMSRKQLISVLDGLAPHNLALKIAHLANLSPAQPVHSITAAQRAVLLELFKRLPLTVKRFRPLEEAIITRGGVSVKQINPSTMESKLVSGLYFAGEVLDVDALTGGFNLQIAFSTGALAGNAAAGAFER
jgi:predicted Rossmann fold flavoprotein